VSCISLRPFRILLHHTVDIKYIYVNINLNDRKETLIDNEGQTASHYGKVASSLWTRSGQFTKALNNNQQRTGT
jgi:hypothetical protein